MSIVLHLVWISFKGLLIYVVFLAAMIGSIVLLFGSKSQNPDMLPGLMGGGILLFIVVFGGLYVFLGGRP